MKLLFKDILAILSILLCNHDYVTKGVCKNSLHSQMVCKNVANISINLKGNKNELFR